MSKVTLNASPHKNQKAGALIPRPVFWLTRLPMYLLFSPLSPQPGFWLTRTPFNIWLLFDSVGLTRSGAEKKQMDQGPLPAGPTAALARPEEEDSFRVLQCILQDSAWLAGEGALPLPMPTKYPKGIKSWLRPVHLSSLCPRPSHFPSPSLGFSTHKVTGCPWMVPKTNPRSKLL